MHNPPIEIAIERSSLLRQQAGGNSDSGSPQQSRRHPGMRGIRIGRGKDHARDFSSSKSIPCRASVKSPALNTAPASHLSVAPATACPRFSASATATTSCRGPACPTMIPLSNNFPATHQYLAPTRGLGSVKPAPKLRQFQCATHKAPVSCQRSCRQIPSLRTVSVFRFLSFPRPR